MSKSYLFRESNIYKQYWSKSSITRAAWSNGSIQRKCSDSLSEDECANAGINQNSECIQFFVKTSTGKTFILHDDEVDLAGMCEGQYQCSGMCQIPCLTQIDPTNVSNTVSSSKSFSKSKELSPY